MADTLANIGGKETIVSVLKHCYFYCFKIKDLWASKHWGGVWSHPWPPRCLPLILSYLTKIWMVSHLHQYDSTVLNHPKMKQAFDFHWLVSFHWHSIGHYMIDKLSHQCSALSLQDFLISHTLREKKIYKPEHTIRGRSSLKLKGGEKVPKQNRK